jgi:hypothetical protein
MQNDRYDYWTTDLKGFLSDARNSANTIYATKNSEYQRLRY